MYDMFQSNKDLKQNSFRPVSVNTQQNNKILLLNILCFIIEINIDVPLNK